MSTIEAIETDLARHLATLDPSRLTGEGAARLLTTLSKIEKLAASGRTLLAPRVAETHAWQGEGDRSAADWLARQAGSSVREAAGVLETGKRVQDLPATQDALRQGRLSTGQAQLVAEAAAVDPTAETDLLATAQQDTFQHLRNQATARRAAATDHAARERKIRAERRVVTGTDAEGAFTLTLRGPAADGVPITEALRIEQEAAFRHARRTGTRDTFENRSYDAFMAVIRRGIDPLSPAGATAVEAELVRSRKTGTRRPGGNNVKVIVNIDHTALQRGHAVAGERCEVAGLGPISVATAQELMQDAFLAAVITKGRDVVNVAHLGRGVNVHQRTALEAMVIQCSNIACNQTVAIEIDHREPWVVVHETLLGKQDPLCPEDHRKKTHHGWLLEPGTGRRRFLSPEARQAEAEAEEDARVETHASGGPPGPPTASGDPPDAARPAA